MWSEGPTRHQKVLSLIYVVLCSIRGSWCLPYRLQFSLLRRVRDDVESLVDCEMVERVQGVVSIVLVIRQQVVEDGG